MGKAIMADLARVERITLEYPLVDAEPFTGFDAQVDGFLIVVLGVDIAEYDDFIFCVEPTIFNYPQKLPLISCLFILGFNAIRFQPLCH